MENQKPRKSSWGWYAVKVLYEAVISGNSIPDTIDENYSNSHKTYEESILLVKAQSPGQAYTFAEKKAKENEMDYENPYGEKVEWRFVQALDCFILFDETLQSGTELYSRSLRVPKGAPEDEVIAHYFPETVHENVVDENFILRNRLFNARPRPSN
ncbi:DUF4288 domain-containing protein [Cohnella rhizosphaerae]|uniref:DUF4288 domain-containing protein n=1 Tax=Cohnella rhizosphaerae TaxID=1457232 RepID=A0A9X4KPU9_9BACL|nr:DUF4288 domain-containing protein [Cohnella rhizosphaerae]MDG0808665.1 DUF4288 domain-containing protein [Cohnella rhizosphaerae]